MPISKAKFSIAALAIVSIFASSGCATRNYTEAEKSYISKYDYDPIEPVNRGIFKFNEIVDAGLIKPLAKGYTFLVPSVARKGFSNFLDNLTSPVSFFNAVLQGNKEQAFTVFWRFTLNSTFGLAGFRDFAAEQGLVATSEDFGQTLGRYGIGAGPYIVLPIIGPSNLRDAPARIADYYMDPYNYQTTQQFRIGRGVVTAIDKRAQNMELIDDIYKNSLDPYATIRSGYQQKREKEVNTRK